ncbi:5-methylthioribose-1-phosphate isomerase [Nitrospina gracilis 3/211]|uniref:Methylthioribose-1-phosphate isomerase n=1 Tax=Nitrospina gracilis (strain 3/211) TaxID=1266370 RepID=M1YV00_NITG3|nr:MULTISPECIES: S-methyl-5-thioribose-1-phosphate isomerase [Nitrospina]MCF8722131.1 methylthioribose-1-phosphate isomerase [Nitrospina sp. Nb-3]CCQ89321.1 5-methylthioribose-1-phosphate isomerase [Nitrospina gracilis 3/211]
MVKTIEYMDGVVRMIDQTRLPSETVFVDCKTIEDVGEAIRGMVIRGAPAIGVAAAMGISLGANAIDAADYNTFMAQLEQQCAKLGQARPTAVNLKWAIDRMLTVTKAHSHLSVSDIKQRLKQEAMAIYTEDIATNEKMGGFGQSLIEDNSTILTHCNAGALATAGFGTALGVVRAAVNAGKNVRVLANETRPFLQGARLTAWELKEDNIPVKLITDNMCGHFMRKQEIDVVVVGADRIAANGDVANKIGTYMVAVMARQHGIPFYVAAPVSTLDLTLASGDAIPIEERSAEEVVTLNKQRIAPEGVDASHPAFDVTPNEFVTAIITERGIARPPYTESLKALAGAS